MSGLHAWRSLRRTPLYTLAALLSLGIGIGLNAAVASAVRGVLLRPLDLPRPERLVLVRQDMTARGGARDDYAGWAVFSAWRARNRSFSALAAYGAYPAEISSLDPPESLAGAAVSHEFFSTLGVRPFLGRGFLAHEETQGRDAVAVLSYGLWVRRFGADPGAVGRTLTVTGKQRTIVGVLPRTFVWPLKPEVDFFVLASEPQATCPFCDDGAAWPEDIVLVMLHGPRSAQAYNRPILVSGILDIGTQTDEKTGFVSRVRLQDGKFKYA